LWGAESANTSVRNYRPEPLHIYFGARDYNF